GIRLAARAVRVPEVSVRVGRADDPEAEPVTVRRLRAVPATGLAAILDVGAEDHEVLGPLPLGEGVVAGAREADLVVGRLLRLGPADAIARIAQGADDARRVRVLRAGQARAHQAVERARVEVAEEPGTDVAD